MKKNNDTLLIIPAFNEEKEIGGVIDNIRANIADIDILVVDDGSIDNTSNTAKKHGASVVSLPLNLGYGVALETGYKYANKREYKYVLQMDADGQHDPKYLVKMLEVIKKDEADIVIGSRFLRDCGYRASWVRRLGMLLFSKISSFCMKKKITDPTSGFQAMNNRVVKFFVNDNYPSDYPDADVIILLDRVGFRVSEAPVVMYSKDNKKSMHAGLLKPIYYVFKMHLSILMIFLRKKPKQ